MQESSNKVLELLERSGPTLLALLTRLTLRRDVAEDLMQELFIKLNNSKALSKVADMTAYARRAAINLAFDWRKNRKESVPLDDIAEPTAVENSPLTELIRTEELEEVLNAIGRLNARCRQALVLRYIQQCSYEQIADEMGKNPHQVRALCSKALSRMREIIDGRRRRHDRKEPCDERN